jgi:glycosyltransferase involved in cell wall biosynthesis
VLLIVADRTSATVGGRQQYAADFVDYLSARAPHVQVERAALPRRPAFRLTPAARVLALSPSRHATHYQLHGGLLASAFSAERESLSSLMRRRFFAAALLLNRRRQRLIAEEAAMLEGAVALMAFSDQAARELAARGVAAQRIRVERPGVNVARFRSAAEAPPGERRDNALGIAFVSHNFALKGLPCAIAALARLRKGGIDATLTVAGAGDRAAARRWAAAALVAEHVDVTGPLTQDRMARLYGASDVLVHPTFYDPFPRVIVEALACGCPVVTTACCGAAEIITPGREGFVIPRPGDPIALSDALAPLAAVATRAAMRRHAAALGRQFDDQTHFRATCDWLSLGPEA